MSEGQHMIMIHDIVAKFSPQQDHVSASLSHQMQLLQIFISYSRLNFQKGNQIFQHEQVEPSSISGSKLPSPCSQSAFHWLIHRPTVQSGGSTTGRRRIRGGTWAVFWHRNVKLCLMEREQGGSRMCRNEPLYFVQAELGLTWWAMELGLLMVYGS